MELRFTIADRAAHHLRDFVVFVTFHVMQHEDNAVSRGQALDSSLQVHPVNGPGQNVVARSYVLLGSVFLLRLQGFLQ